MNQMYVGVATAQRNFQLIFVFKKKWPSEKKAKDKEFVYLL